MVVNMKVGLAGHTYEVNVYDGDGTEVENITFVMRNNPKEKYSGNEFAFKGTNCQEVLRVLIDRITYLQNQRRCQENEIMLHHLRHTLYLFEWRHAKQIGVEFPQAIMDRNNGLIPMDVENFETCRNCGHWFCEFTPCREGVKHD